MTFFVRVLVDRSEGRELDYSVPDSLRESVAVGSRVVIMVRNRRAIGIVLELLSETNVPGVRPISGLVEEGVSLPPVLMELARWIAGYYCAAPASVFKAMLPPAVRGERIPGRRIRVATLARRPAADDLERIGRTSPRQRALLEHLGLLPAAIDVPDLLRATGSGESSLRSLVAAGWITLGERRGGALTEAEILPSRIPELNPDQAAVIGVILESISLATGVASAGHAPSPVAPAPFLLHGVTGSGKTEVYLRTIEAALAMGKSALVLVPEIALTPQTVERFRSRFDGSGHGVAVLHSHLGDAERREEWLRIKNGGASIVIGARSAVFAPLGNLGLIIVDEEHEGTYKQEESPRYHARDTAVMRARLEGCPIVLGSATPSIESYRNALAGKYRLLELPRRADGQKMPLIRVVDLRLQGKRARNDGGLSAPLQIAITRRLELGQQVILFLNRRGYSTSVLCEACGHVCRCPNCSLSLTLHRAEERMACHLCGHSSPPPACCPECRDPGIRHSGIGTQRVEETLRNLYPKARIARMDADTMTRKGSYAQVLGDFRARKTDILLGTQMIAKGLDFPNVTLVGIVNADTGLHSPDFRAGERTFQLLTQVAGRAGRGEAEGEVLIQTFSPASPSIQYARHHDFAGFYEQEITFREAFGHPPFRRLLLVRIRGKSEDETRAASVSLSSAFREGAPPDVSVSEAAPAPIERSHGQYRYHVTLRGAFGNRLASLYREVLARFTLPEGVAAVPDVDPSSLM